MTGQPSPHEHRMNQPTDNFMAQALRNLPVCQRECRCADRWHVLWAGLKATGVLRGVHAQAPLLRELLAEQLAPEQRLRVLIAGAADSGSLQVLAEALAAARSHTGVQYTVADPCPAPLELVRQHAEQHGLIVQTHARPVHLLPPSEPWHLVFAHYTLGFMTVDERAHWLRRLRTEMAMSGIVVCAVRERVGERPDVAYATSATATPATGSREQRTQAWIAPNAARLATTFAAHQALLSDLLNGLGAFAASRMQREEEMPRFDTVRTEFAAAGFVERAAHLNPGGNQVASAAAPGSINSWLAVFSPA